MKDTKMKATVDLSIHVPCVMSQTHCLRVVRHIGCDTTYTDMTFDTTHVVYLWIKTIFCCPVGFSNHKAQKENFCFYHFPPKLDCRGESQTVGA